MNYKQILVSIEPGAYEIIIIIYSSEYFKI
jgi:hypothetical protein